MLRLQAIARCYKDDIINVFQNIILRRSRNEEHNELKKSCTVLDTHCIYLLNAIFTFFAAGNRSYEKKIAATIGDKITIEAQLSIPNLTILKLELPVNGKIEDTSVYVLRNVGDTQENPSALDDGFNMG